MLLSSYWAVTRKDLATGDNPLLGQDLHAVHESCILAWKWRSRLKVPSANQKLDSCNISRLRSVLKMRILCDTGPESYKRNCSPLEVCLYSSAKVSCSRVAGCTGAAYWRCIVRLRLTSLGSLEAVPSVTVSRPSPTMWCELSCESLAFPSCLPSLHNN